MSKKAYTVFLIFGAVILLFASRSSYAATTDPRLLLKHVQEKLKASKSISYDIHYQFKYFNQDDTQTFDAHVDILREPNDTLAGCYLLVRYNDGFRKFYDTKNLYYITPKDTSIEVIDIHRFKWSVTDGNTADGVINQGFVDPSKLDYYSDTDAEIRYLGDSGIGGDMQMLTVLSLKKQSKKGFEEGPYYTAIDPTLPFVRYRRGTVKWQGKYQFIEAAYSNVEFDKVDSNYFQKFSMPKDYRMWNYEPRKPLNQKPLVNDILAPDFTAKMYPDTTKTTRLSKYRGKIVVLDFWYMSCLPCVQALPVLDEINKQYAGKGVIVLGVNSTDLRIHRLHKMPDFLKQNPITYSTIMPERSVDDDYHVSGYPTLYIIDKKGKIVLSHEGYGPKVEKIITDKLDEMLK